MSESFVWIGDYADVLLSKGVKEKGLARHPIPLHVDFWFDRNHSDKEYLGNEHLVPK